jgi:nudix-type nucleoside diphosphatase (YffH/AdpP family)
MAPAPVFFYGSLRDETLLSLVLGRDPASVTLEPARLPGWALRRVKGEGFPCVVPEPGAETPGELLRDAAEVERARILFFEDDEEFTLRPMTVEAEDGPVEALVCLPTVAIRPDGPWRFEDWPEAERAHAVECAREIMALYERGADWSDPALWPGIKARAAARARAAATPPRPGLDAGRVSRAKVETRALERPYAGFFAVEEHRLALPTFAGGRTPEVGRSVWVSGDAVTVLPYDAARDAVLLISQWRAGPHARGDRHPWPVEVVAGRLEGPEDPESAARREAMEEAGLVLGRMELASAYYPSPGTMAEHVTSYVAEADLSAAGGLGGVEHETEDVLSVVLPFADAMDRLARGEIDTSPALISLFWLARERPRLRAAWAGA